MDLSTVGVSTDGEELSPPSYELYPVRAVLWATAFGTLIAGGIVMAINYGRLGEPSARGKTLALAILGSIVLFAGVWLAQDLPIPDALWLLVQMAVMHSIARSAQGPAVERHLARGGTLLSVWRAVGIGLLCTVVLLAVGFGVGSALFELESAVVEFNEADAVYYKGGATEEDARFLGEALTRYGVFGSKDGVPVEISASSKMYTVSFFVVDHPWENPDADGFFQELGEFLADERFGRPITIELRDENFEPRATFRIE